MALLLDTSGLVALLDSRDRHHQACKAVLSRERGPLVVVDLVIPEVDCLLVRNRAYRAEEAFLDALTDGSLEREAVSDADLLRATALVRKYRELDVGIVDASLVAVAERRRIQRVLSLDVRHFRTFRLWGRKPLVMVP